MAAPAGVVETLRDAAVKMRDGSADGEVLEWHLAVADFLEYAADYSGRLRGITPPTVKAAMDVAHAFLEGCVR